MGKDTFWFKHDYHARNDEKVIELIDDYGSAGYGEYWIIGEQLHEEDTSSIELTDRFYRLGAKRSKMSLDTYKKFIHDCEEVYHLFYIQNGFIGSKRVDRNKADRTNVKNSRSLAGKAGAMAKWGSDGNCHQKQQNEMAIATDLMAKGWQTMANDGREDKSIEDKSKKTLESEELGGEKISPTPSQILERKRKDAADRQRDFYESLVPYAAIYGKKIAREFYEYWGEMNKSKTKMLWELKKTWDLNLRIQRWVGRENDFQKPTHSSPPKPEPLTAAEQLAKLNAQKNANRV